MAIAIGYIRVSSELQRKKGSSLDDQREMITEKAKRDKNELLKIYEDAGISGGSTIRPALQELLKDARQGKFQVLYFSKLDRLGRSNRDIANLYHELVEVLKIDLISVSDPSLNTVGAMGKVLLGMLSVFAEFERSLIRERMHSGMMYKWSGNTIIIGSVPFGYKREKDEKGRIVPDPETSKIYKKIVAMYLEERLSTKSIALELTKMGIQTPSASKNKKGQKGVVTNRWDSKSILCMLKSPSYCGTIEYNTHEREWAEGGSRGRYMRLTKNLKEGESVTTHFIPLISKDRWNQIQLRMESQRKVNRHQNKDYPFLLGPFVYCGICGTRLRQIFWIDKQSKKAEKSGKVHRRYRCYWRGAGKASRELSGKERCIMKLQDADDLEGRVWTSCIETLTNLNKYAASWIKDLDGAKIEEEITTLNAHIEKLSNEWETGFINLRSVHDLELKEKGNAKQKILENELKGFRQTLSQKEKELQMCINRSSGLLELDKLLKGRFALNGKTKLKGLLVNLAFEKKKQIIEGMVSPELGGRITISYVEAGDIYDNPENPDKLLIDQPTHIDINFMISPERIMNIIEGLDKTELKQGLKGITNF